MALTSVFVRRALIDEKENAKVVANEKKRLEENF